MGDAELDEGDVWEAVVAEAVSRLGNVLWIVDVNRQSLVRIVPDSRRRELPELSRVHGWRLITRAQTETLRDSLGIAPGEEWAGSSPRSPEARLIGGLPPLFARAATLLLGR